jgi:uncharacterized membrane protein
MNRQGAFRAIFFVSIALYPVIVYFGIQRLPIGFFGVMLVLLLLLRYGVMQPGERRLLLPVLLIHMAYSISAVITGSQQLLLYYPALVNFTLCALFVFSLKDGESILLRLVRARKVEMSVYAPRYLNRLTIIWAVFFLVNGSVAILTTTISMQAWALYNGFIAYLLIGALFVVEFVFRHYYKRRKGI